MDSLSVSRRVAALVIVSASLGGCLAWRRGAPVAPVAAPADRFQAAVRPVLLKRCAPCHEPGGRMYTRLPFDDAATVRANKEAVLRRLKVEEERAAVEGWLAAR